MDRRAVSEDRTKGTTTVGRFAGRPPAERTGELDGPDVSVLGPVRQPSTTHQFAYELLKRAILRGTLQGGARLVQADIAAELNVSITPIREAMRDLAAEGLIQIDPHRGGVVREVSLEDVREVYYLRKLLEPVAARRAVKRISQGTIEAAAKLQAEMDAERDPGRWVELNRLFHGVLLDAAESPRLAGMIGMLQDAATLYVAHTVKLRPIRLDSGNTEHRAILDAFIRRDAKSAQRLVVNHLNSTIDIIEPPKAG